jgi:hypothetical protein
VQRRRAVGIAQPRTRSRGVQKLKQRKRRLRVLGLAGRRRQEGPRRQVHERTGTDGRRIEGRREGGKRSTRVIRTRCIDARAAFEQPLRRVDLSEKDRRRQRMIAGERHVLPGISDEWNGFFEPGALRQRICHLLDRAIRRAHQQFLLHIIYVHKSRPSISISDPFPSGIGYNFDMTRLASRLLVITLFIAVLSTRAARSEPAPIELSITTDKASYRSGEPVSLTLELRNASPRAITLVHPDYWGTTELEVRDSSGAPVEPETFKGKRKSVERLLTLGPGEKKRHTFSAMTIWTCCHAASFELRKPGRYQLTVRFTNPPVKSQPPPGFKRDWTGTIAAAPTFIEVTAK